MLSALVNTDFILLGAYFGVAWLAAYAYFTR